MAEVVFYEKPGCVSNSRQKRALEGLGHEIVARNLLTESWTVERLRAFFADRPVVDWFNRSAPRIKSGEIRPERLAESEALQLMLSDPVLIRRPLIETAFGLVAGFTPCDVLRRLGIETEPDEGSSACPRVETGRYCGEAEVTDA